MSAVPARISELLIRQIREGLNEAETRELENWMQLSDFNRKTVGGFSEQDGLKESLLDTLSKEAVWERVHDAISTDNKTVRIKKAPRISWWAAAAVFILLATTATLLWYQIGNRQKSQHSISKTPAIDPAPGKEGAILTLADGSQVVLDSLGNGLIATQNGARVVLQNGKLAYNPAGNTAGKITYNTMSTPRGRQFQLTLPDGTGVWLNAGSSITFPTAFTDNRRTVEVTGEVYFEVATVYSKSAGKESRKQPFFVKAGNQQVEVLGTHFNINSYADEGRTRTTLLEGSVRVSLRNAAQSKPPEAVLKPGQQAIISHTASTTASVPVVEANTQEVMAWKNGLFNFQDAGLEEVMRQLSRWYDLDVVYEEKPPHIVFAGKMGRNLHLSKVLHFLEKSGIQCRVENKKLIVLSAQ